MKSEKNARRESRIVAVETMFSFLEREGAVFEDVFEHVLREVAGIEKDSFAESILRAAIENLPKIRVVIRAMAPEFAFEKIAPIHRAILVLGIAEMKFIGTPPVVVINEYIELAKMFGEAKSAGFVNGVLDSFRKGIGAEKIG